MLNERPEHHVGADTRPPPPTPACLRARLRRLLDAFRESDHALTPAAPRLRQRVSGGTRSHGIVLDERTLALRTRVVETLGAWARLVVEEAGSPRLPRPRQTEAGALVRFLGGHLDWLARHPAAADFAEELTALLDACDALLGPAPSRGAPVGACPEAGCGGTLRMAARRAASGSGPQPVACESGHSLPPHRWLLLSGSAGGAGRRVGALGPGAGRTSP